MSKVNLWSKIWLDKLKKSDPPLEELTGLKKNLEFLIGNKLKDLGNTFEWWNRYKKLCKLNDYKKLYTLVEKELKKLYTLLENELENPTEDFDYNISLGDLQEYLRAYFAVREKIKEKIMKKSGN